MACKRIIIVSENLSSPSISYFVHNITLHNPIGTFTNIAFNNLNNWDVDGFLVVVQNLNVVPEHIRRSAIIINLNQIVISVVPPPAAASFSFSSQ